MPPRPTARPTVATGGRSGLTTAAMASSRGITGGFRLWVPGGGTIQLSSESDSLGRAGVSSPSVAPSDQNVSMNASGP